MIKIQQNYNFCAIKVQEEFARCFFIKILRFLEWGGGSSLSMWTESVLAHPVFIPLFTVSSGFLSGEISPSPEAETEAPILWPPDA